MDKHYLSMFKLLENLLLINFFHFKWIIVTIKFFSLKLKLSFSVRTTVPVRFFDYIFEPVDVKKISDDFAIDFSKRSK